MGFKHYIQIAIIIIQIVLFVIGTVLTLLKVIDNMWPFTIVICGLCFLSILIGWIL